MAEEKTLTFEEIQKKLSAIDVSGFIEKKTINGTTLTYLSWASAWGELIKLFPTANYEIERFDGKPYLETPQGYMVFTKLTICDHTREMWLPVMDSTNRAKKTEAYSYKTTSGEKRVGACDMMDINKTIMRCLVKNIAMFGLGLNVYQGEDLPNVDEAPVVLPKEKCASCGKDITDHGDYKASTIINRSKQEYGKPLCFECSVKARKSKETPKQNDGQQQQ